MNHARHCSSFMIFIEFLIAHKRYTYIYIFVSSKFLETTDRDTISYNYKQSYREIVRYVTRGYRTDIVTIVSNVSSFVVEESGCYYFIRSEKFFFFLSLKRSPCLYRNWTIDWR